MNIIINAGIFSNEPYVRFCKMYCGMSAESQSSSISTDGRYEAIAL
jgi:hypothetical protein